MVIIVIIGDDVPTAALAAQLAWRTNLNRYALPLYDGRKIVSQEDFYTITKPLNIGKMLNV